MAATVLVVDRPQGRGMAATVLRHVFTGNNHGSGTASGLGEEAEAGVENSESPLNVSVTESEVIQSSFTYVITFATR